MQEWLDCKMHLLNETRKVMNLEKLIEVLREAGLGTAKKSWETLLLES